MKFSFFNSIEDYIEELKVLRSINPMYKFYFFLPWFFIFVLGVILFFDIKADEGSFLQLLVIVLTLVVFTFGYILTVPKRTEKIGAKILYSNKALNKSISLERTVKLTNDSLILAINNFEATFNLSDINQIIDQNNKLFVIDKRKKVCTIIPYDAFHSSDIKNDFINRIKKTSSIG